jgi:histidine triad (HIT) family protein
VPLLKLYDTEVDKMDTDCVFCKIAAGEIPSNILYQDEDVIVFPDIKPITPVHLLIVSRKHIPSLSEMTDDETPLVGHMTKVANQLAKEQGIAESGYRLTINSGAESGQLVPHLHMHLMGGRALKWSH